MTQPTSDSPAAAPPVPPAGPPSDAAQPRTARPERTRPDPDRDLADHDLSDHDEALFHSTGTPWRHLTMIGLTLLVASLVLTAGAAFHLNDMSGRSIGNAVLLPRNTPTTIALQAGEQRMLYTERGTGITRCEIRDGADAPVRVEKTSPVILQGSDVLWHGESIFTAGQTGNYTIRCQGLADARVGRPVGTLDIVLTVLAAGIGGLGALAGLGLLIWGRARRRATRR